MKRRHYDIPDDPDDVFSTPTFTVEYYNLNNILYSYEFSNIFTMEEKLCINLEMECLTEYMEDEYVRAHSEMPYEMFMDPQKRFGKIWGDTERWASDGEGDAPSLKWFHKVCGHNKDKIKEAKNA